MIKIKDQTTLIQNTILAEMYNASHAANMPESFIQNIKLKKISDGQYEIENDWQSDDKKPLAVFFEYGTDRHWIAPLEPDGVLAWESKGPQSGSVKAIYSKRADNKKGNTLFSKGHYVEGLRPYEPMTNGFRIGIQKMKEMMKHG